jgi:hypothetical protein
MMPLRFRRSLRSNSICGKFIQRLIGCLSKTLPFAGIKHVLVVASVVGVSQLTTQVASQLGYWVCQ